MTEASLTKKSSINSYESHAKEEGAIFGKEIADLLKNWQGPATIATIAGVVASRQGIPIGNTQLGVGLAMVTAGAVAEAISAKDQHPQIDAVHLEKKVVKEWLKKLQGPSNVSLIIGIIGMLKKIKGSEAAFIAGAIGTVLNTAPILYESAKKHSSDEYMER